MAELGKNVGNFQNFAQFIKSLESINDMLVPMGGGGVVQMPPLNTNEVAIFDPLLF